MKRFANHSSFKLRSELFLQNDKPYIEFFRSLLKTEPYEKLVADIQLQPKKEDLKTDVFKGNLLDYLICLWTSGWRKKLIKRASRFEAVVVIGCESAYESVQETLKSTNCQVFQGMVSEGVLNAITKVHLSLKISFKKF